MRLMHAAASAFISVIVLLTALPALAGTHTVLYTFQGGATDGTFPLADLIEDGGIIYGTTYGGGGSTNCSNPECGTVFAFDLATSHESVLKVFNNGPRGGSPLGALLKVHNKLFGTNSTGGFYRPHPGGYGAVFSVNLKTGRTNRVFDFSGTNGSQPEGGVINVGGTLYGTSGGGSISGCCGIIFAVDPATGNERVIYSFPNGGSAGAAVQPGLLDFGGMLFGTTYYGGSNNCAGGCGVIFSVNPATGSETVVHDFEPAEGYYPHGKLINVGGTFYGTTAEGGKGINCVASCGTVFALNPTTGAITAVYSVPNSIVGPDLAELGGKLYGTTYFGGPAGCPDSNGGGCGTIFEVNPKTGTVKTVYEFQGGNDGGFPAAGLVNVRGTLYGTTEFAGNTMSANCMFISPNGCGTLFSFKP